ncbi:MAG: TrkH family potassium uptake protein [Alphaproteobacteria bacterium]|nr:TrkH family potassium uptake protein [Alphaproteobacteria bacterium]
MALKAPTTAYVAMHRQVARPCGFVLLGMAAFMVLCALVGLVYDLFDLHRDTRGGVPWMVACGAITGASGGAMVWWGQPARGVQLRRAEATLTTALVWTLAGVYGALPFVLDGGVPVADGIFEAVSGFTTTGATIVADIEGTLSRPVLLWRSVIQWLGGMGIVVLFIAVFPSLGVTGKHMFRTEVPGHSAEGLKPKITETSAALWRIYAAATVAEIAVLWALFTWWVPKTADTHWAENLFDAVCHALTTLSTGGFSTKNASVAYFESGLVDYVISGFMLFAGVNFGLYYGALIVRARALREGTPMERWRARARDTWNVFFRSVEFRAYCGGVAVMTVLLTIAILPNHHGNWLESLRYAFFMVATTVTSTGYGTDDYMAYPSTGLGLILLMMLVGGMSGSTAGGVKVSRMVLLAENTWGQLRKSYRPNVVQVTRLGREIISEDVLNAVATFFFLYITTLCIGSVLIAYTDGVGIPTAFGAMLTSVSNMGPGPYYEGADNFARYTPIAKILFSFAMILGRLEFFTVLALFMPEFWKH